MLNQITLTLAKLTKIFKLRLIIITISLALFYYINSNHEYVGTYDPCGYVGSYSDPETSDFCLKTSTDCCYATWELRGYVYNTCFSKKKMLIYGNKNISSAFVDQIMIDTVKVNISWTLFTKCNNTDDVVVSPDSQSPPDPYEAYDKRELSSLYGDYNEFADSLFDYVKMSVSRVFNFFFEFLY